MSSGVQATNASRQEEGDGVTAHRRPPKPFTTLDLIMMIIITTLASVCILVALASVAGWQPS